MTLYLLDQNLTLQKLPASKQYKSHLNVLPKRNPPLFLAAMIQVRIKKKNHYGSKQA
jgi:hypothetical protein